MGDKEVPLVAWLGCFGLSEIVVGVKSAIVTSIFISLYHPHHHHSAFITPLHHHLFPHLYHSGLGDYRLLNLVLLKFQLVR